MRNSGLFLSLVTALISVSLLGCGAEPKKRARTTEPTDVFSPQPEKAEPPAPERPPEPKCISLKEKCTASATTRIKVGTHGVTVKIPEGWTYAKEEEFTLALPPEADVAVGFTDGESTDPDKIIASIAPLLERMKITNVKMPALKMRLRKPQSTLDANGSPVGIWEVDKTANQGADPKIKDVAGKLVVVAAKLDGSVVVGAAFMIGTADEARGAAAGQAIQTLRAKK